MQVPNQSLVTGSLSQSIDRLASEAADELEDLRGELQILVYTEATPGPKAQPVLARTVELGRDGRCRQTAGEPVKRRGEAESSVVVPGGLV